MIATESLTGLSAGLLVLFGGLLLAASSADAVALQAGIILAVLGTIGVFA